MMDDHQAELAALYALDLLEGAEKSAFEASLAENGELRRQVEGLRAAAAELAHLAPAAEPPAELKTRVLASVAGLPAARPVAAPLAPIVPFGSLLPWAVAACLAIAALWAGRQALNLRSENAVMRDQQRLAQVDLTLLRTRMEAERVVRQRQYEDAQRQLADATRQAHASQADLARLQGEVATARRQLALAVQRADAAGQQVAALTVKLKQEGDLAQYKISTLASMLGNSPKAIAVAVWNPMEQEGMLKVSQLPMPASGKDYQLWVIDPQYKSPVSAGVVTMDPATGEAHVKFKADKAIDRIAKFAISLEAKGGMPEPHGPVVMLSE
jgi:anti-sigma-K factor RskA